MKNKTAMQELIEWMKTEYEFVKNSKSVEDRYAASAYRNSIEKATELLEKEKEDHGKTFKAGEGFMWYKIYEMPSSYAPDFKNYFTQTYQQ